MRRSALSRNHYFIFGILVGLALSLYLPEDVWDLVQQEECPQEAAENSLIEKFGQDFEPHLNLISKPLAAKKPAKNVNRPRYYSSELGIREKIFIGVMTSQENINTLATAINRTTAHLVNKIKFFINADNVKTNYKLKNIVGFTDTRESLRPFHVIKYIADNYLDDYDYFLIMPDTVYVDARKLKTMLYHISITFDLYMGTSLAQNIDEFRSQEDGYVASGRAANSHNSIDDLGSQSDHNFCDLNGGILLSSSVIRKMRNNLDWCVRNGVTNVHSVNIGRCVKYSSNLSGCQTSFQGVHEDTYTLQPHIKLFKDLNILAREEAFRNATLVYPITSVDDFYRLHAYYSKVYQLFRQSSRQPIIVIEYRVQYGNSIGFIEITCEISVMTIEFPHDHDILVELLNASNSERIPYHLELVQKRSFDLERKSYRIANGTISNNILEIRWPLGVPLGSAPETRHDIITWHLINSTHIFLPNAENIIAPLSHIDKMDFVKVLEIAIAYAKRKHPQLEFINLHTAYRKFDATRGMDYQFHMNMRDVQRSLDGDLVTKSFQVVKPLGRVEVIPSPYVTESTRIAILVPTFEHQLENGINFVTDYERVCMQNQDNTFLLMIFLYRYDSMSKGENDPFKSLKTLALDLSTKYKNDGSRIAWVSIRLPTMLSDIPATEDTMLNSLYGHKEILSIAVADLALPKIGLDSLVLMASTDVSFKADFLNRVRMNTIQGFQIYSPIGFMMYPCRLAYFCRECDTCDVSQGSGYFDKWNYDLTSFYSRDYVQARKMIEAILPITRNDNDIEQLITRTDHTITTILDMFVASQLPVHILRGTEPNLRYGNAIRNHINNGGNFLKYPASRGDDYNKRNDALYNEIPQRYDALRPESERTTPNNDDHEESWSKRKCIHLASRKQIGDAIIRYEDRSILHK